MSSVAVIIVAAGRSSRFDDRNYKKPYAPLQNRPVWLHSVERFVNRDDVKQIILVIAAEDREMFQMKFGANVAILGIEVVDGGAQRADSVLRGLERVRADIEFVAVHDAVRPCLVDAWIDEILAVANKSGAAIPAIPVTGTLKRSANGHTIDETVARLNLWEAQTPQIFRRELLLKAYASRGNLNPTDDAQVVEAIGHKVSIVVGSSLNLKITTRDDLKLAEQALKALPKPKLPGFGHPFADDDKWR
jgi:2-C-methyl-D-erythritol 4-phosphate cytidylyltransferase